jgi:UrcA family protein
MKRFTLAMLLTAALAAPALAGGPAVTVAGYAPMNAGGYQMRTVTIAYGDLDLSGAPGAAMLLDRIQNAARVVCGERAILPMSGERKREFAACQAHTVALAVQQVNAPTLTQVAAAR